MRLHHHLKKLLRSVPEVIPFDSLMQAKKGRGFVYKNREFISHTDLPVADTALESLTPRQKSVFVLIILFLAGLFFWQWRISLLVLVAISTIYYFADLLFQLFLVIRSFTKNPEITISDEEIKIAPPGGWPSYTIFCPLYREGRVLPDFVTAINELDYPKAKLRVLLLLEADDQDTINIAKSLKLPSHFKIVVVPHSVPKTKPKAMNYGLQFARGEYVVVYDAEDKPEPKQLRRAVLAFQKAPADTVCVQAKLNFYNPTQNFLTRLFTAEYSLWFDLILPGLQSIGAPIPLGGTSNHFRIEDIQKLQGWDGFNVTEDCDLGMRIAKAGFRTAIVDSTTYEEANSNVLNWYRQRSRWVKGYIQTYLVHMRHPVRLWQGLGWKNFVIFQVVVGGKTASMFINPFLWLITISYFAFRSTVAPFIEPFFPSYVLYVGVASLVFGNFLYTYYYMVGLSKRRYFGLVKYALLVPFYWLGMSLAATRGLYEVFVKPHYWAKTEHGLHLASSKQSVVSSKQEQEFEAPIALMPPVPLPPIPNLQLTAYSLSATASKKTPFTTYAVTSTPQLTAYSLPLDHIPVPVPPVAVVPPIVEVEIKTPPAWRAKLASGGVLVGAIMLANVLNFLFNAYLGRTISLAHFAVISLFGTLLGLLGIVTNALGGTVNRQVAFLTGRGDPITALRLLRRVRLVSYGVFFLLTAAWLFYAPAIAHFFKIDTASTIAWFAPVFLLTSIAAVNRGYLQGRLLFALTGASIVTEAAVKLVAAVLFVQLGKPELASLAIPISLAATFAVASVMVWMVRPSRRSDPLFTPPYKGGEANSVTLTPLLTKEGLGEVASTGKRRLDFEQTYFVSAIVSSLSVILFVSVDVILANHYLEPNMAGSYGLLSLIGKMIFLFGTLPSIFTTSLVAEHLGEGKDPAPVFRKILAASAVLTLGAAAGLVLFGGFLLPLMFGNQINSILPYLPQYSIAMAMLTIASVIVGYHLTRKHYKLVYSAVLGSLVIPIGIVLHHENIASFTQILLVAGLVQIGLVIRWHVFEKNNGRFIVSNLADLLGAFAPAPEAVPTSGKRILVFNWRDTKHAFAGGAELYIHELARRWVTSGNQVTLFCGNDGQSSRTEVVDGVSVVRRGGFYTVYAWAFVYYMTQFRGRFDVIIDCENGIPFFTPLYAKEKVLCLLHHVHQDVFRKYLNPVLRLIATFMESKLMPWVYRKTKFITISNSSHEDMQKLGIGLAGIDIVHPGVDLENLRPGRKSATPLVLYLGRLKAYKSVDVLIRSFMLVLSKIPQAKLVVAGGGEEQAALEQLTAELGIEDHITFTGKISESEKISWLQRAWVFVNPSMMEGWGITNVEANACGVPVVAANVPGSRDSVRNPHTGYLVPHGDEDALAVKIINLLEEQDVRDWMGKNGLKWANRFSWDTSAAKSLGIIYE